MAGAESKPGSMYGREIVKDLKAAPEEFEAVAVARKAAAVPVKADRRDRMVLEGREAAQDDPDRDAPAATTLSLVAWDFQLLLDEAHELTKALLLRMCERLRAAREL